MASTNSPFDVYAALYKFGNKEMTWDQVKEVAQGVEYGPWQPSSFGDIDGIETFADATSLARYNKTITPEQLDELKSIGILPAAGAPGTAAG